MRIFDSALCMFLYGSSLKMAAEGSSGPLVMKYKPTRLHDVITQKMTVLCTVTATGRQQGVCLPPPPPSPYAHLFKF